MIALKVCVVKVYVYLNAAQLLIVLDALMIAEVGVVITVVSVLEPVLEAVFVSTGSVLMSNVMKMMTVRKDDFVEDNFVCCQVPANQMTSVHLVSDV